MHPVVSAESPAPQVSQDTVSRPGLSWRITELRGGPGVAPAGASGAAIAVSAPFQVPSAQPNMRILAVRGGLGGGCHSPMNAVLGCLQRDHPDLEIHDPALKFAPFRFERGPIDDFRYTSSDHAFLKGRVNLGQWANSWRRHVSQKKAYGEAVAIARQHDPGVIFVNHRIAADFAGHAFPPDIPLVVNIPDHGKPHAGWMLERLCKPGSQDTLLVSNVEMFDYARSCGVPAERIRVAGYPVRPEFEAMSRVEKGRLREEFGIPADAKVVTIASGGGRWNPDLPAYVRALAQTTDSRAQGMHVFVVSGGDQRIVREVKEIAAGEVRSGITIHLCAERSTEKQMAQFMRMATVGAVKFGGGAIGELYALRVPVFGYDELSGIEPHNRRHVVERKTGEDVRKKSTFVEKVLSFTESDAQRYVAEQDKLNVPGSAQWISEFLHAKATRGPEPAERFDMASRRNPPDRNMGRLALLRQRLQDRLPTVEWGDRPQRAQSGPLVASGSVRATQGAS